MSCESTPRDRCERMCDADRDRAPDFCKAMAVMKGRRGTKAFNDAYSRCIAMADDVYIECYQECDTNDYK
jgi:hypothetical protein